MREHVAAVQAFAASLRASLQELDGWVLRHQALPEAKDIARWDLQLELGNLDRVAEAVAWGPSVGLYGESQCGKSNLVSRFASSVGAVESREGNLCVLDPGTPEGEPAPPWRGEVPEGIDFRKRIDPGGKGESTGIVCRFTSEPVKAPPGHFRVNFISHAELLCALSDGFERTRQEGAAVNDDEHSAQLKQDAETLDRVRKPESLEDDADATMVDLLKAYRMFETAGARNRLVALDRGLGTEAGSWKDFVQHCVSNGTRPKLGKPGRSEMRSLVSMLWGGDEALGDLWFALYADLRKLRRMRGTTLLATDVCKMGPDKRSIVDVLWLDQLAPGARTESCLVFGETAASGRPVQESLTKGSVVALTRELVLPIRVKDDANRFDVLDFPGARVFDPKLQVQTDDPARFKLAIDALKRGKLNRLFVAGIEHFDSSVLCLVANAAGNQEASGIVRGALHAWLCREGWRAPTGSRVPPPADAPEVVSKPPLVLAMTQVDELIEVPARVEAKLEAVRDSYAPSPELPWMERWQGDEPFQGAYWVYNPKAKETIIPLSDERYRDKAIDFRGAFNRSALLRTHTADVRRNLDALFDASHAGEDIGMLVGQIREMAVAAGARRVPQLGLRLLRIAGRHFGRMRPIHLGLGDPGAVAQAQKTARMHAELIAGLRVPEAARLLGSLALRPDQVLRAWSRIRRIGAAGAGGVRGSVAFEAFFGELNAVFREDFREAMERPHNLWKEAVKRTASEVVVSELATWLCKLPNAKWFRESVRDRVQERLEKVNTAQLQPQQLAAVVSAQWNRCMTWLAADAPASNEPPPGVPTLRGGEARNRAVVSHWSKALPAAYAGLVDEQMRTQAWNNELGACLERLGKAVQDLQRAVASADVGVWGEVQRELAALGSAPVAEGAVA